MGFACSILLRVQQRPPEDCIALTAANLELLPLSEQALPHEIQTRNRYPIR